MKPLVKICGVTRPADAVLAATAGADFVGIVFHDPSPRNVSVEQAMAITKAIRECGGSPRVVGVFVNRSYEEITRVASAVPLDVIQLHGDEGEDAISRISLPVIKALHVRDTAPTLDQYVGAEWVLYDTFLEGRTGGTGRTFDWSLLDAHRRDRKFFLSGGLNAENIVGAIQRVAPDGVDVSSGVEDSPGIKSAEKLSALFKCLSTMSDGTQRG